MSTNVAVFVDFENLHHSLESRAPEHGGEVRDLCLQVLSGLLARLREAGNPVVLGRSYACFDVHPGSEVAHDLALMGLDPQYVLATAGSRASGDIQLALDVAKVLFRRPDIQEIVIVSGDRDFIPLARQVLEEGRELRVVSIPDATSGDLLQRVGSGRFWNALELAESQRRGAGGERRGPRSAPARAEEPAEVPAATPATPSAPAPEAAPRGEAPNVVGHIPVTWKSSRGPAPEDQEERLLQCLELLFKAQVRHNSPDIWLSPFLKGPMTQHFPRLIHPERRALVNDLRDRGAIRIEERDNLYADHPYSVIVIQESHPLAQAAKVRLQQRKSS